MMLLVSGTRLARDVDHAETIRDALLATTSAPPETHELFIGDARGVDDIAARIVRRWGWQVHLFEARWEECAADCPATGHRRQRGHSRDTYCPGAGMRRNRAMIAAYVEAGGKVMLAFPAANTKSAGTRGCIRDARKAGLVVPDDHIVPLTVEVKRRG